MESIRFLVEVMKLCSAASCVNAVFVMQCSPGFAGEVRRFKDSQGRQRAHLGCDQCRMRLACCPSSGALISKWATWVTVDKDTAEIEEVLDERHLPD
jgi:hypothetical protein